MRLSVIRACAVATVATLGLAACANQNGMTPSTPMGAPAAQAPITSPDAAGARSANAGAENQDASSAADATASADETGISPALTTCATQPPQYEWIFKGACDQFTLLPAGAHFTLGQYQSLSVKGLIGKNNVHGSAKVALADAIDKNGDIEKYKGATFPPYKANGTTYVYATAVNQGTQIIKPISVKGKPVLQYVITNAKGFGSNKLCAAAVLTFPRGHGPTWKAIPATGIIHGKTVTISQYTVPSGFALPPKVPLYFAINCYK